MLSSIRSRLTYANVVSTACLFVVLGGTSYAVATGSIDSREIKNSTIRSKDIRNNQVRGADVNESTLGRVPAAEAAVNARSASQSGTAGVAGTAQTALTARTAENATQLGGTPATGFLRAQNRLFQVAPGDVENHANNATLASLTVPSGQYLVVAQVSVSNDGPSLVFEACTLDVPQPGNDETQAYRPGAVATAGAQVPVTVTTGFTGAGTIALRCENLDQNNDARNIRLVATLVS